MAPTRTPRYRPARVLLAAAAASAALGLASVAQASDAASPRRVPPELVGAWCPTGGCPTAPTSAWSLAAFASAVGLVGLLSRRQR